MTHDPLAQIQDLHVELGWGENTIYALQGIRFPIARGVRTGLVGESGSGKSMTALAILRLLPEGGRVTGGQILFEGEDVLRLDERHMRQVRGKDIGMVFQNAHMALNPLFTVGEQIADVYRYHEGVGQRAAWQKAVDMLDAMGIPEPGEKARQYPHQFSGGMAQRAMVAMALVCAPQLLIADEPTTGLDVTIQAQVLELIVTMVEQGGASLLLISHDLGVIAEICSEVVVMYAGQILEIGSTERVLRSPANPYTQALIACFSDLASHTSASDGGRNGKPRMNSIPGTVPDLRARHTSCPFADRCPLVEERCWAEAPALRQLERGHWVACHLA